MKKIKKISALALSLIMILSFATACGNEDNASAGSGNAETTEDNVIRKVEAFTSVTTEGEEVTEKIFSNSEVTMINMWGTFCSPCINEMPDLEKISKEYEKEQFQLIGIVSDSMDKDDPKVKNVIEKTGVTYTNIMNSDSLVQVIMNAVQAVPTTVFVDSEGNIIHVEVGGKDYDGWKNIIDKVLENV